MEDCKTCFRICDPVPDCLSTLAILTSQVDSELIVKLIDKFNNFYQSNVLSESSGLIVLDLENEEIFPKALINPYAGQFKLIVEKDGVIAPFIIDTVTYDCLIFECAVYNPKLTYYTIDVYGNETGGY